MKRTNGMYAIAVVLTACALFGCGDDARTAATDGGGASGSTGSSGAGAGVSGSTAGGIATGGNGATAGNGAGAGAGSRAAGNGAAGSSGAAGSGTTVTFGDNLPAAGNPDGHCAVPADAQPEDSSHPDHVIGTGTPDSCTGSAFVAAVAQGGVITFDCGPDPVTITLDQTAKVFNDKAPKIVIDGGGKVTLSGGGKVRILYQNTCDPAQVLTSPRCDNQDTPQLTVQNITMRDGNAKGLIDEQMHPAGGGAIFATGGRLKVINSRFFANVCDDTGTDVGGGAIRAFEQSMGKPLYIVNSTFGGTMELANVCANGGGLSSIGVSYTVLNSRFGFNQAIGRGANSPKPPDPGGGNGGAIYNDGDTYTLTVCGTQMEHNHANEGGGAIFYVSNDMSGTLSISDSTLTSNPSDGFETQGFPGTFVKAKGGPMAVNSTLTK